MESTSNSDYDSPMTSIHPKNTSASRDKAARSAPKSKKRSRAGGAKDATRPQGWKPAGSEVGLSILQAGFDQALDEGVKAILEHFPPSDHMPHHRIAIQILDAKICPNCQVWTGETICPACQTQIG